MPLFPNNLINCSFKLLRYVRNYYFFFTLQAYEQLLDISNFVQGPETFMVLHHKYIHTILETVGLVDVPQFFH